MAFILVNCGGKNSAPKTQVAGEAERPSTGAIETGAQARQDVTPVKPTGAAISEWESTLVKSGATVRILFRKHIHNQASTTSAANSHNIPGVDEKQAHQ